MPEHEKPEEETIRRALPVWEKTNEVNTSLARGQRIDRI